jgi:hypothetical protein
VLGLQFSFAPVDIMWRIAFVLLLALGVAGCGSTTSELATPTTAYMLASLDYGSDVSQDDPSVAVMPSALDALTPKCTENESKIGDMTGVIHDELKSHQIDETYLSILQHVDGSIPASAAPNRCADIFAAYAVLRESQ